MLARVFCNGARVRCPLVFCSSPCLEAHKTSGHVTPLSSHVCLGTDKRLHTRAAVHHNGSDKSPRDHGDEELPAEDSKPGTFNPEQWNKIAASYVHKDGSGSKTAGNASSATEVLGTEPEKRQDYDLKKLLENISVLKSAEASKEEAGKATEKPRRTTPMSIGELVEFLQSENAQEICVINVPPEMQYVQYFVTCSGKGLRHISKIAHSLVDEVKGVAPRTRRHVHVEGADSEDWMVVDLGDVVVHFMLPAVRKQYQLEKLWTLGPRYDDQFQEILKVTLEAQKA